MISKLHYDINDKSWRHDVKNISRHQKILIMKSKISHDFNMFVMMSKISHYDVKITSWCQIDRHDVKNPSWCQNKSQSSSRCQKVLQNVNKCVMTSKIRHDVKRFVRTKIFREVKKSTKGTSWRQQYVMMSRICHNGQT